MQGAWNNHAGSVQSSTFPYAGTGGVPSVSRCIYCEKRNCVEEAVATGDAL